MNATDARAPLSIVTEDLTLSVGDAVLDVRSTGDRLFVEVDTVRDALTVARNLPDHRDAHGPAALLTATDLTTEIRVRGRTVAVIGADARPGRIARELGVAPAEVRLAGALGAGASGLLALAHAPSSLFD